MGTIMIAGCPVTAEQLTAASASMSKSFSLEDVRRALVATGFEDGRRSFNVADALIQRSRFEGKIKATAPNEWQMRDADADGEK